MIGVTLDAGGLIALDRNDRRVLALLALAAQLGALVTVPAAALAQAIRHPAHVVICARRNEQPIVTSDPRDLARLDPTARLIVL